VIHTRWIARQRAIRLGFCSFEGRQIMSSNVYQFVALPTVILLLVATKAFADDVQWFNSQMQDEWWDAVGETTTIDFTGFEHFEPLRDQYAHLGVLSQCRPAVV
jgi:hypothetical protein